MAAIQNDRDVLLQAASVRVVPVSTAELDAVIAATKGIKLTAPSNVFHITKAGVASPSSITMYAELVLLPPSSIVQWSVISGSATLTGTGMTRTLLASNVYSDSVTVRVTAQEAVGAPYFLSEWTIARTVDGVDGANGSAGADGQRGSITTFGTLTSLVAYPGRSSGRARWANASPTEGNAGTADTAARNRIWQVLGNSGSPTNNNHLRLGDSVTLTNATQTVSATGHWTGAAWDTPGTVIDGNLLVGGNVAGQEFTGGTFTGGTFRTAPSGDRVEIKSSTNSIEIYSSGRRIFNCRPSLGFISIEAEGVSAIEIRGGTAYGIDVRSTGSAALFRTDGAGYSGVVGQHAASGAGGSGVYGIAQFSAAGVMGQSRFGWGGRFENTNGTKSALHIVSAASLPTDKTAGSICYLSGTGAGLYYADGSSWKKVTAT